MKLRIDTVFIELVRRDGRLLGGIVGALKNILHELLIAGGGREHASMKSSFMAEVPRSIPIYSFSNNPPYIKGQ